MTSIAFLSLRRLPARASRPLCTTRWGRPLEANASLAAKDAWSGHRAADRANGRKPPGWEPTMVDMVVSATAQDVMRRPCLVGPKPNGSLLYVADDATTAACARIFAEKKVGALLVNSAENGQLVGIMSERDFVKALAAETVDSSLVKDLMTPVAKMITVSLGTAAWSKWPPWPQPL